MSGPLLVTDGVVFREPLAQAVGSGLLTEAEAGVLLPPDPVKAALARQADVLIVDTAGRLHTKANLMDELAKLKRVIEHQCPGGPHESLMVLDAPTGQNGFAQAQMFHESIGLTGVCLTKLDGTAKGGVVVAIQEELRIPVQYIGVGEDVDDLQTFEPESFVRALFARG